MCVFPDREKNMYFMFIRCHLLRHHMRHHDGVFAITMCAIWAHATKTIKSSYFCCIAPSKTPRA